jgi:hypothetical protein
LTKNQMMKHDTLLDQSHTLKMWKQSDPSEAVITTK